MGLRVPLRIYVRFLSKFKLVFLISVNYVEDYEAFESQLPNVMYETRSPRFYVKSLGTFLSLKFLFTAGS